MVATLLRRIINCQLIGYRFADDVSKTTTFYNQTLLGGAYFTHFFVNTKPKFGTLQFLSPSRELSPNSHLISEEKKR